MAHPSSPTRHLVERKALQKIFAPTARRPAIGLSDTESAGASHIGASYADVINKFPLRKFLSDLRWPKSRMLFICILSGEEEERAEGEDKVVWLYKGKKEGLVVLMISLI